MRELLKAIGVIFVCVIVIIVIAASIAWWVKAETDKVWLPYVTTCESKGGVPEWNRYSKAQCWDKIKGTRIFW